MSNNYDAGKVKAASHAALETALEEAGNLKLRVPAAAALVKLTAARDAEQLESLCDMARSMRDTFESKGNDAGVAALDLALDAVETGYREVTGATLGDAAIEEITAEADEEGVNGVGIFSTRLTYNHTGNPHAAKPKVTDALPPQGALTISALRETWPKRLDFAITEMFDAIKPQADAEPSTLHETHHFCEALGEQLTLIGGKFRGLNMVNFDGEQKEHRGKATHFVTKACYEDVVTPYLQKLADMPLEELYTLRARLHATSQNSGREYTNLIAAVAPCGSFARESLPRMVADSYDRAMAAGTPPNDDGGVPITVSEKALVVKLQRSGMRRVFHVQNATIPNLLEIGEVIRADRQEMRGHGMLSKESFGLDR